MNESNDFAAMVKIAADTPEQLRACDIGRLLSSAKNAFGLGVFYSFVAWLHHCGTGPRIHAEINAWLADEESAQIEFDDDTFSLTFDNRSAFNSASEELSRCPFGVLDVGYADMRIIFDGGDAS